MSNLITSLSIKNWNHKCWIEFTKYDEEDNIIMILPDGETIEGTSKYISNLMHGMGIDNDRVLDVVWNFRDVRYNPISKRVDIL